jgi:hypothetical protein
MGGTVRLTARVTERELRQMYERHRCEAMAGEIGFRLSFKSLGKTMKQIAKPATLLKLTTMAARLYAGDVTALQMGPGIVADVKRGMAAKRVMDQAARGNPRAQRIMERIQVHASSSQEGSDPPRIPGMDAGVMRYLSTVQSLAGVRAH